MSDKQSVTECVLGRPDGSSHFRSVVNYCLIAIGVGILALPKAIAQAGWVVGVLLLLLAAGLAQYAMVLLYKSMRMTAADGTFPTFQAVGKNAFGVVGMAFVSFVVYLDLVFVCALLVILVGDGMETLVPSVDTFWWKLIFTLVMLPLSWLPSMKEVAFVSAIGIFATLLTCVAVVAASAREIADPVSEKIHTVWPLSLMDAVVSLTNFFFAFTVAPVIPTLVVDMKKPEDFPKVSGIALIVISVAFAIIGFAGYLGFGTDLVTYANISEAIAHGRSSSDWLLIIVEAAIEVVCFSHYLVMLNPVSIAVEDVIKVVSKKQTVAWWLRILARSILVFFCFAIAVLIPAFSQLVDLISATLCVFLQLLFPVGFYWILTKRNGGKGYSNNWLKYGEYALMAFCVLLGVFSGVIGTWSVISSW
ncbi:hypothetical protein FOL47_004282 [Perkinsus chesapeaki]|uniref:Amino acid transporter transmembrane domain-containing protein n=1 Tax=Perkinsus chesapeaki TaxID=330153 RepID=A0A7J6M4H0_PERCH|nr:hypothetical protein FOL47_004282 [Perkinsus chesapeaki]